MLALFFIFGGITSLNDVIIPKLKELFTLDHMQAMLVQSAFFAAYFIVSLPGAALVRRLGYMRGAVVGLLIDDGGLPAVHPGLRARPVRPVPAGAVRAGGRDHHRAGGGQSADLAAGPTATAHSRLTFAQAFNSLGTTVFPYVGSILILGGLANVDRSPAFGRGARRLSRRRRPRSWRRPISDSRVALALVAGVVWLHRNRLQGERHARRLVSSRASACCEQPRFAFGAPAIFLYVGAEVAIGSLIVALPRAAAMCWAWARRRRAS